MTSVESTPLESTRSPEPAVPRPREGEPKPDRFRGDVAGLRAIAVGLVLLYHAGLRFVPGGFVGVDVFFVISGFLITGQLVSEIGRTGRVSLAGFYARRAKRILPAAAVVLVATAAGTYAFVSRTEWRVVGVDILNAAVYVVNWRLADRSVDYLAQDSGAVSPVQHYWSLAVEEQFYIVWPLLIIAVLLVARALRRRDVRPLLWVGLLAVAVPSFAWSLTYTAGQPARAFFVSTTRMWELAIGAAIALVGAGFARLPRVAAIVLGWAGVAAVVTAALLVTTDTAWPGYAAALPTLGAAAVVAAGFSAGRGGPVALLGTRPFRWVGDLSYSLYLWHWPMIVIATAYYGALSWWQGLVVALLSVLPAWVTYKIVENPLRYSPAISRSPRFALSLGANFTLLGVAAGLALVVTLALTTPVAPATTASAPGGAALSNPYGATDAIPESADHLVPDPANALYDTPDSTPDCFRNAGDPEPIWCTFGDKHGTTTIALIGDSKMDQWLPAFETLAPANHWRIVVSFKAACPFTSAIALTANDPTKPYTDCTEWNSRVTARLVTDKPDYVITSQGGAIATDPVTGESSTQAMADGMRATWAKLEAAGIKVIALANNPSPGANVDDCVLRHLTHLSDCAFDRFRHDTDSSFQAMLAAFFGQDTVRMIDMFPAICPDTASGKCPAVIGNVLVYRSGSHITATYVRTLAPRLAAELTRSGLPTVVG